jgi:hypothetical protein
MLLLVVFLKEEDFKEDKEEDKAGEEVANILVYVLK